MWHRKLSLAKAAILAVDLVVSPAVGAHYLT